MRIQDVSIILCALDVWPVGIFAADRSFSRTVRGKRGKGLFVSGKMGSGARTDGPFSTIRLGLGPGGSLSTGPFLPSFSRSFVLAVKEAGVGSQTLPFIIIL